MNSTKKLAWAVICVVSAMFAWTVGGGMSPAVSEPLAMILGLTAIVFAILAMEKDDIES